MFNSALTLHYGACKCVFILDNENYDIFINEYNCDVKCLQSLGYIAM